jgi:putative glutamine amidotransferase
MPKPIILITTSRQNHVAAYGEIQAVAMGCNIHYVEAIVRAGGAPVLLPRLADREAIHAAVDVADGVMLTGGGDIGSLRYGEEPHVKSKWQDSVRDEMELDATRLALERGLPILGICRGIQLLNVAMGGTLVQDVPSQVPDALKHYSEGLDALLLHTIAIEQGSLLARLFATTSLAVNSYHHQAVKEVGAGLRVSARAPDGVIEGLEATDGRSVLGVQFHPEEIAEPYPQFQALFDWLVGEARVGGKRNSRPRSQSRSGDPPRD